MKRIYLDHASASPVDKRVIDFASKYLAEEFGNPSALHTVGNDAKEILETARGKVAKLINAENPNCIIFTSGATESNNLGIRGVALRNTAKGKHVVSSVIEHISVVNSMKDLTKSGFIYQTVPVDCYGLLNLAKLSEIVTKETILVSIIHGNNEIGTVQPINQISKIVHEKGAYLHLDATASAGRIPIDVQKDGIDLLTLSSNDLYGPQGTGALYVKTGIKLQTIMPGGGQERGLRSGTENLFAITGMGEAARIALEEMGKESKRLSEMRDKLISELLKIKESCLTGHPSQRLPHHASFRFERIEGESILLSMDMENIQVSTGSACSSKTLEPSSVLLAIGLKQEEAHGSMVMTLGRSNTMEDMPMVGKAVQETVERLRRLSPL